MKDLVVAIVGVKGAQGLGRLFLEEKCFQRRGGNFDHNFVVCNLVTYRIVPVEVIVEESHNWITKSVLRADAYIFVYNSRFPETYHRLKDIMARVILSKGTDRFPSIICELYSSSNHRIVPSLSGKHLAEQFGFKFSQADVEIGTVRPIFMQLTKVYKAIVNIETRIRRRRQRERVRKLRTLSMNEDIRLFIAGIVVLAILTGLLLYSLACLTDPINNTRSFRHRKRR